jgi:hypothetical protein
MRLPSIYRVSKTVMSQPLAPGTRTITRVLTARVAPARRNRSLSLTFFLSRNPIPTPEKTSNKAYGFGGGVDVKISDKLAIRAGQVDYINLRISGVGTNNLRMSFGIVAGL